MTDAPDWLRRTELDRISLAEMAAGIARAELDPPPSTPRSYPGYPTIPLPVPRPRWWPAFDGVLRSRRCRRNLSTEPPSAKDLGRILWLSHGVTGGNDAGPTPSAGGLQAMEVYAVNRRASWLPVGVHHYDRRGHALKCVRDRAEDAFWREMVPSLAQVEGGGLLFVLVADAARIVSKYGSRGERFALLEAGHLMQNLCLAAQSVGWCVVPVGGYLEEGIADECRLLATDVVAYVGVCGR